jgi:excisionase family DNA binding protein
VTVSQALAAAGHGPEHEAYVDRAEMARILGVSVTTLDDMVARHEIPSVTWGRRVRRFSPSAVIRALEFREVLGTRGEA